MNTQQLLESLGWPVHDLDKKGSISWQGPIIEGDNLPATASLTVTPKVVRARVLNISGSHTIQPHFEAEWDITSSPVLTKCVLAGENITERVQNPVADFTSLVALVNNRPHKVDIMGFREKKNATDVPVAALKN